LPEVHGDAETEIYLGKPNDQKTREQMALELTALTEQAPTADPTADPDQHLQPSTTTG
jgi:hypothetical protein